LPDCEFCILHIDFPKDKYWDISRGVAESKKEKVREKINRGDFNYGPVNFRKVKISGNVDFNGKKRLMVPLIFLI